MKLGVNIDHVATLRQARQGFDPDPLVAARVAEKAGADSIVCHLREDRRHVNDEDVRAIRKGLSIPLNLEMSLDPRIVKIAGAIKPDIATIVPERRQEITTEGGLDVIRHQVQIAKVVKFLEGKGIKISLFVDPVKDQIKAAQESGAQLIELHTGCYAGAKTANLRKMELSKLSDMTLYGRSLGLRVSAGHGLNYDNTPSVAMIAGIEELNIGHAIIARAVFVGLEQAVKQMRKLMSVKK